MLKILKPRNEILQSMIVFFSNSSGNLFRIVNISPELLEIPLEIHSIPLEFRESATRLFYIDWSIFEFKFFNDSAIYGRKSSWNRFSHIFVDFLHTNLELV